MKQFIMCRLNLKHCIINIDYDNRSANVSEQKVYTISNKDWSYKNLKKACQVWENNEKQSFSKIKVKASMRLKEILKLA